MALCELLLQRRGKVRIRIHSEGVDMRAKGVKRLDDSCTRHARTIAGAATVPRLGEVTIAREIDEPRFPSVVVFVPERPVQQDLLAQVSRRGGVEKQVVFGVRGLRAERRELVQLAEQSFDIRDAIERPACPGGSKVPPLRELPGRPADAIDRTILARRPVEPRPDGSPQGAADTLRRIGEPGLDPAS